MTETKKSVYAGVVVMLMILSGGTTYYLEQTGDYKNCYDGGWQLLNTGQYECKSRGLTEWCFELSAMNKEKIQTRCYIGRVIHQTPDYGDFAEKIEGDEMVRHIDTYDYEVWGLQDKFNVQGIQKDIDRNKLEISTLESKSDKCKELKDEKYIAICEQDINREINFIMGENAMFETKLEKVK